MNSWFALSWGKQVWPCPHCSSICFNKKIIHISPRVKAGRRFLVHFLAFACFSSAAMYSRMYMEKDCCLLHYYACAAAVLLLIATPPSPPRTTPLFSNTTLFVICYALCAAYLSASAAEILSVCAVLIAAGGYNIRP